MKFKIVFLVTFLLFASVFADGAAGDIDTTFGTNGKVVFDAINGVGVLPSKIAVQADGKIIQVGNNNTGFAIEMTIVRFLQSGTIDNSFGANGITRLTFGDLLSAATDVAVQPDGKIVVVGVASNNFGGDVNFAVARLNANGTADNTFGTSGRVTTSFDGNLLEGAFGVALQPDGKIVVAGTRQNSVTDESWFAVARYNANGTLDNTFDGDGRFFTKAGVNNELTNNVNAVTLQPDGKIILVGQTSSLTVSQFALMRLTSNGNLDSTFNDDGKVQTTVTGLGDETARAVAVQSDGKIITAGYVDVSPQSGGGNDDFGVVRYNSDGALDATFSNDGKATFSFGTELNFEQAQSVTVLPNGKILIGGYAGNVAETGAITADFALVKLNSNGTPDTAFGNNGFVKTSFAEPISFCYDILTQADGKIVAGGFSGSGDVSKDATFSPALVRYLNEEAVSTVKTAFDFDGDRKADISVFRPANTVWYASKSSDSQVLTAQWGIATDKIVPADYNGDGKTDFTVFRDGFWYILNNGGGFQGFQWGSPGDVPFPADFDADGKDDLAVFRTGIFFVLKSSGGTITQNWGSAGDIPVVADYDGDLKADFAVYRNGIWFVLKSSGGDTATQWGIAGDKTVQGDYNGDNKADFAVFRAGFWYILTSQGTFQGAQWGASGDLPAPADYDGDGKTDLAVFRNGTWFIQRTTAGVQVVNFGNAGDKPIPNAFVP